ncbi:MAG: phosphoribosylanthranilate isomerase [Candidatus Omnitrophica bacterium]|nr:phosphoribosylanthranilate isomerase [Candidatus Omnitrophota bacterium]
MTRIKFCGIRRRQDLKEAIALGIDYVGLNFYPESSRYLLPDEALRITQGLPTEGLLIGVFVNAPVDQIVKLVESLRLAGVQLHGQESGDLAKEIKRRLPQTMVIKAIRVSRTEDFIQAEGYPADFFLLDSFLSSLPGGTGRQINQKLLRTSPLPWEKVFLAGGIRVDNVDFFIKSFHPFAVDICSGVERQPGVKNKDLMAKLVSRVREANGR